MKLNRLAIAVAAVLVSSSATAHAAVPLPGMNPVVSSSVQANSYKSYTVNLRAEGESFWGSSSHDYDYLATTQRGQAVSFGRDFNQYDGSKVNMSAYANSNFKVNKVAASMIGAAPAPVHTEYGSTQANQNYWDSYIQKNYWSSSSYESVYELPNDRYINVPTGTTSETDVDGYVHFGYRDANDNWVADTRVVASYAANSEYGHYLVAATMPAVEIDATPERYVSAHSQWENIFYFDNKLKNGTTGTATFKLHLTGDYSGDSGYFRYMARDWEHKDTGGTYLKYEEVYLDDTDGHLDKYLTVAVNFQYGTAQYVKSEADAQLWGEGNLDFSHSVEVVEVEVPEGTTFYSYASYLTGEELGFNVAGGIDGNTLPGGAGEYFGSGGGGTVIPGVPEPETYAMMLAGLALVGWSARRRRSV